MLPGSVETPLTTPRIQDLQGLWRRLLITWPNGTRDETTQVRWLQGRSAYMDLRQPALLPAFSGKRGLLDMSMEDCAALARQEGFAGQFRFDGRYFEWTRSIDFQPKPLYSDVGSLWWGDGNVLIEQGRDIEYIEHWHRDDATAIINAAAVTLRGTDCGTKASLLRVGAMFMFARDRSIVPAPHKTLPECTAEVASIQDARALIDCEISFGEIGAEGFQITASSLPYRVGDLLNPRESTSHLTLRDLSPSGAAITRRWDILEAEGDPILIAAGARLFRT
jgi:hypothetical protein